MRAGLVAALASLALQAPAQQQAPGRVEPNGIPVRYAEGTLHGFLDLTTAEGRPLGNGDLVQLPRDRHIEATMTFRFADSSYFEEEVTFTQRGVFELLSYKLIQRGPAFEQDLEASFTRNGQYVVKTRSRSGEEQQYDGVLELPADVYNGLVIVVAKNLRAGETQTVHVVAFTPRPRLIRLEVAPVGEDVVRNGRRSYRAVKYRFKPRLGALVGFFARLTGKLPPDAHTWVATEGAPSFIRYEGPLFSGPVWRINLSAPTWPATR